MKHARPVQRSFFAITCLLTLLSMHFTAHGQGRGLEEDAMAGVWDAKAGRRGGGLIIEGTVKIRDDATMFNTTSGTCTMLIKPDASAVNAPGGLIFAAEGLELVKTTEDATWLELRRGNMAVRKMIYDLKPGKWMHLAMVWKNDSLALVINGKTTAEIVQIESNKSHDGIFLGNGLGKTVFDEIQTFDRALPADEIAAAARISLRGKVAMAKPVITLAKTTAAPVVDGNLDDEAWENAAGFANFAEHRVSRFPAANRATQAWMTWDDENMYLAFRIPVTQMHPIEKNPHDKMRWGDRTVELFFQPNPSGELEYYQLAFDAAGTQYEAMMMDATHDAPWAVESSIDDEWWTAEVAIPYATINAPVPAPGHRWKMNVVCTAGMWSPSARFHDATRYGVVKFSDPHSAGLRTGVTTLEDGGIVVPWHLAGHGELVVRATAYPNKGVVPLGAARVEATPENASGDLRLDLAAENHSGLIEIIALDQAGDTVYRRFIKFDEDYFADIPFLKDQPEEVRNPQKKQVKKDASAAERKAAEAADWRPTIDEIEDAIVEQQKWLGNDIGKAPAVPEPWTPMELDERLVKCWGKEFDLAGTVGLPRQVRCLEQPLFAFEPALEIAGENLAGATPTLLVKSKADEAVEMIGAAELDDVNMTLETRYEFDGFTRYDLTLTPMTSGASVDGLRLILPFAKERALYYHVWGDNAYGRPTPEVSNFIGDKPFVTGFEANVWIGDDERGFCWFAEAPKGWSHPDADDLIRIVPGDKTVEVVIDMLRGETTLTEPLTITFGTMATPAKPRPPDWRTWEGKPRMDWWWYTVFSFPYPSRDPEAFRRRNENPFHMPMLSNFFAGHVYRADGHPVPEQWLWGHLWSARWKEPRKPYGKKSGTEGKIVGYRPQCMASSWPDFFMYKLEWMREEYNMRSIYLDTCVREAANPFAGYTWTAPDGSTRGSVDIFAFREFQKRIYNFIKQDPEGMIMMHHSNQVAIPVLSFADIHMNGEHFNTGPHQVAGRHYSDPGVMPPGAARSCYTLKQWGAVPNFLPEHPASTRAMMGYLWAHDMLIQGAWCDFDELKAGREAKFSFGMADVEFLPYWGENPPTSNTIDDVYVSAWRKIDGSSVLLIIANMTDEDLTIPVTLLKDNLALGGVIDDGSLAVDVQFGHELKIKNHQVVVPVKEHDFRLLKIDFRGNIDN